MDSIKKQIAELDALAADPLPTPPVGTMIVWYRGARRDENNPSVSQIPAIVQQVDGPGKVKLIAFPPQRNPENKQGCLHIKHPIHLNRANSVSVDSGAWDYPDGTRPAKFHFDLHLAEIARQKAEAERNLAQFEKIKNAK
jgi:hypothetical protein